MVFDLEPLENAFLVEMMAAGQFDDFYLAAHIVIFYEFVHANGADPQLVPHFLIYAG